MTDAQAQEMVGLLTKMEALLASRVGSIWDERMPSTQVFQRVEGLSRRFNDVVERLCEVVITRHDAQVVAGRGDLLLRELQKHTLALESIRMHLNGVMIMMADEVEKKKNPKKKAR